jgi:hypothetical protein
MKQTYQLIIGFIAFFLGFISIVLSLIGLKLDVLSFLYSISSGFASFVHLVLMFGGICLMYYSKNKSRFEAEEDEEVNV